MFRQALLRSLRGSARRAAPPASYTALRPMAFKRSLRKGKGEEAAPEEDVEKAQKARGPARRPSPGRWR